MLIDYRLAILQQIARMGTIGTIGIGMNITGATFTFTHLFAGRFQFRCQAFRNLESPMLSSSNINILRF
jgi:hypothetical protein